ncbi:MAG: SDR family oxidoreductase [Betaproteobacteria bacterium]|nr:SDR family oxidoreductase [Betaproteobacteria bacterium]
MDLELKGRTVLVTGASRGIGYACAHAFAKEGCALHLVSRSASVLEDAARRLRDETGASVTTHCLDLSHEEGVDALAPLLPSIDILVNNAGAIPGGGLDRIDRTTWRESWNLKLFGYVDLTRLALEPMMARGNGVIVNVIGTAGVAPRYDYICGSTANAGLNAFTKAVGAHSARKGVRVLGVNPGLTETDRLVTLQKSRAAATLGDESRWRELMANLPMGRPATPEEVADLVVFLASARAAYLTGIVVDAEGGALHA